MINYIFTLLIGLYVPAPKSIQEAEKRYGKLSTDYVWPERDKFLVTFGFNAIKPNKKSWVAEKINRDMALPLARVMIRLEQEQMLWELGTFLGCYSPRSVRGPSKRPSVHAYSLGCDFLPDHRTQGKYSERLVKIWKEEGFCWGGDFKKPDRMHFSYSWECQTSTKPAD